MIGCTGRICASPLVTFVASSSTQLQCLWLYSDRLKAGVNLPEGEVVPLNLNKILICWSATPTNAVEFMRRREQAVGGSLRELDLRGVTSHANVGETHWEAAKVAATRFGDTLSIRTPKGYRP